MPACTKCSSKIIMARDKLNILSLNSIEKSVWGGLENWMELSGLGLARRGHRIAFAGRSDSLFLKRSAVHDELKILPVDISGDFNPATIKKVADIIRDGKFEVVLCNFVKDVRLAGLARLGGGDYKIVWTPGVNLAKKSLSHKWLFSGFVDKVIVPSRHLRDQIVSSGYIGVSRFEVIPIGIDDSLWQGNREEGREFLHRRFNVPTDAMVCLTSARFVRQKGHCYLIDAVKNLEDRCRDVVFVLLGDGPLQTELAERIRKYDLTDRFVFCGLLKNHRKAVFGADLYVHPAVVEPFGIVLVEAMAASLPVIASRVGGIPEVVEENRTALLVEPGDIDQMARYIEKMYAEPQMRDSFGRAGYERYRKHFRMETMIDRIEKTICEVAG